LRDLSPRFVQVDECWTFVFSKQMNTDINDAERGDQFVFHAIDKETKLILAHRIGKRDAENTHAFMSDLHSRIATAFQLTTDGFQIFPQAVYANWGSSIDYAQQVKIYSTDPDNKSTQRRYSPGRCTGTRIMRRWGYPVAHEISTSHVERTNLSLRIFNRRFTRLTLGYSKKLEYLRHAVALFVAHFNFCRVHSAHAQTPAQAAGLAREPWSIEELLKQAW
jgi:IS1 family transposase